MVRMTVQPGDGLAPAAGTAGEYNWSGYAGTTFWVDPNEPLVAVMMAQSLSAQPADHRNQVRQLT